MPSPPRKPKRTCARRSRPDRKSTRLNPSHVEISYAVFCLKKKKDVAGGFAIHTGSARALIPPDPSSSDREEDGVTDEVEQVIEPVSLGLVFFKDTATTEIYTLSLHDALPI